MAIASRQDTLLTLWLTFPRQLNGPMRDVRSFTKINNVTLFVTYPRTTYRIVEPRMTFGVGLEWTAARFACPCRYEKGKEDKPLAEPYILPAKQPIRRRVFESLAKSPPMTLSIFNDVKTILPTSCFNILYSIPHGSRR